MPVTVGKIVEGTVTGITNFGAFIQLPEGKSGLVHISEISHDYVKKVSDYLSRKGISVEAKIDDNVDLNFNSSNPKIMTYHSSKGLQFEAVFLPECTVSGIDDRNPLYVAITRTYQSLYVMHSGNLSDFFDDVPTNLYETSINTKIEDL